MTHHQVAIEKYGVASTLKVRDLAPRPPSDDEVAIDVVRRDGPVEIVMAH